MPLPRSPWATGSRSGRTGPASSRSSTTTASPPPRTSLRTRLDLAGDDDLTGRSFVDIGSGSGLFSLAARNLGATVHSFDFDPHSVACTTELRRRYHPDDPAWTVRAGLRPRHRLPAGLGQFDIVYSWGVLHHTGAMWTPSPTSPPSSHPAACSSSPSTTTRARPATGGRRVKQRYNRVGARPAPRHPRRGAGLRGGQAAAHAGGLAGVPRRPARPPPPPPEGRA